MPDSDRKSVGVVRRYLRSLTGRILLAASLWMAVVLVAGGILLSLLFRETLDRNLDARLSVLLDNLIGVSNVADEGIISLFRAMVDPRFDQPYSGWYWQISEQGQEPFRSRSLWDQELSADLLTVHSTPHYRHAEGPEQQQLRVIERDIILADSDRTFRFIVAADTSEILDDIAQFNKTLLIWLAALGAGLIAAMVIQVRYGLRPLRRIRSSLTRIRTGEKARLESDFPNEVMPLVDEMNALLSHNEAIVERARTHVGNLAHSLKTPLTVISNEASMNPDNPMSEIVERHAGAMSRNIHHHLARARAAARGSIIGSRTRVEPVLDDLKRVLLRIYNDRGIKIGIEAESGVQLAIRGERQDLEEMLGNLMDNACKWARTEVRVTVALNNGRVFVTVEDDGPGIAAEARAQVFGRGERIDESVPGTGLGLSIVKDIAELCEGEITLAESELGGLKASLSLPFAESA